MKKTIMAAAVVMAMGAGVAQAAVTNFTFTGSFLMYDGLDPANANMFDAFGTYVGPLGNGSYSAAPAAIMNNGNGMAGDPITGTMAIDMATGAGTATMAGVPFFGDTWKATNVVLTGVGPGLEHASMLFHWGALDPTTACGLVNCDIQVDVRFQMGAPDVNGNIPFATTASWMLYGPFAGAQPTFSGTATVVPVPAAVWLLGSGLLGLVGVARRKAA